MHFNFFTFEECVYMFYVTCPKGLESLLQDELESFDFAVKQTVGAVYVTPENDEFDRVYELCYYSRFANRVIYIIDEFIASDKQSLFSQLSRITWLRLFDIDKTIAVDFRGKNHYIKHSNYGAMLVKDAIVDHFYAQLDARPNVDPKNPEVAIFCAVKGKKVMLGIDVSGGSLHKRGFRLQAGKAPLKENLAAALIARAKGFLADNIEQSLTWLDPFCGSGTLLIEAVLADLNIASQALRESFGFEHIKLFNHEKFLALKDKVLSERRSAIYKAKDCVLEKEQPLAIGYDQDPKVIDAAQQNIERAGLEDLIEIKQQSLKDLKRPAVDQVFIVSNPPYGERLSEREALFELYSRFGHYLKHDFQGGFAAILCSDRFLLKAIGLQKSKAYKFFNANLETQWVLYKLYKKTGEKPKSTNSEEKSIAGKLKTIDEIFDDKAFDKEAFDEECQAKVDMVANRLRKNRRKLAKWARQNQYDCYRVYDADMPEYAFVLDIYKDVLHISEYLAPKSVDEYAALQRKRQFLKAVEAVYEVPMNSLVLKERKKQKGNEQYTRQDNSFNYFTVSEGEAKLSVNLRDYLDTGLFLDHRLMRLKVAKLAEGKCFLNLFCYTASITVHAAIGGAVSSDSVDMSQTYLRWAEKNFKLNNIDLSKHQLHRANVMEWVADCKSKYDLVFLDPPSFSNSKRMEGTFDVQRDQEHLIEQVMQLLNKDGLLIFSNNLRSFKLSQALIDSYKIEDVKHLSIDKDFERRKNIHQCWFIRHQ